MSETKRLPAQVYSPEKADAVRKIVMKAEAGDFPALEQETPIAVRTMYQAFVDDFDAAEKAYCEKRSTIVGVAVKVGPDPHGKPSIEVSDRAGGECFALCVFKGDIGRDVPVGDTVVCRGNLPGIVEPYGMVFKKCEVIEVHS